jgi:hypothetical protein
VSAAAVARDDAARRTLAEAAISAIRAWPPSFGVLALYAVAAIAAGRRATQRRDIR